MEGLPTYRSSPLHSRRVLTENQMGGLQKRKFHDVTQHCQARTFECLTDSSKHHGQKTIHRRQSRANGRPKILVNTKLMTAEVKEASRSEWLGIRGVSVKFYLSEQNLGLKSNRLAGHSRVEESQARGMDKIRAWSIRDTTSASYQVPRMKGILKSCSSSSISEEQRAMHQNACRRNSLDSSKSPKKVQFESDPPLDAEESFLRTLQRRAPPPDLTQHDLTHSDPTHYDLSNYDLLHEDPTYPKGDTVKFSHRSGAVRILSYDECMGLAGRLTTGHHCYNSNDLVVRFADETGEWAMNKNNQGLDSGTEDNDNGHRPQTVQQDKLLNFTNRPVSTSILKFITRHQNLIPPKARLHGSTDRRVAHMAYTQNSDKEMLDNVTPKPYLEKRPTEIVAPERLSITSGVVAKHCESMLYPVKKDHCGADVALFTKDEAINNDETAITYVKNFQLEGSEVTATPNNETQLRSSALNKREMTSSEKTQFIIQWLKEVECSQRIRLPNKQFRPGQIR